MRMRVILTVLVSFLLTGCFEGQQAQVINPSREYFIDSSGGLYEINRGSGSPTLSQIAIIDSTETKRFSKTQQWPFFGVYLDVSFESKMINDRLFYQLSLTPALDPSTGEMTIINDELRSKISKSSINILFQDFEDYVMEEKRISLSDNVGSLDSNSADRQYSSLTMSGNFNINSYLQSSPFIDVGMAFYGTN